MSEHTISTRIALLYKTYAQWDAIKDTYTPLKGEICFCEVPGSGTIVSACILFKVGDGSKIFSQLPWCSGLAADVFAWAKKENLLFSDLTTEFKESMKEYIGASLTNTLYRIVSDGTYKWQLQKSEDGGTTWVNATGTIDMSSVHFLHFVGVATKEEGETEAQAVERAFPIASQTLGAVAICGNKEFIASGSPLAWNEFGDASSYATKAELEAEGTARATADTALGTRIDNLTSDNIAAGTEQWIFNCNL